jgi:hypothetical protein
LNGLNLCLDTLDGAVVVLVNGSLFGKLAFELGELPLVFAKSGVVENIGQRIGRAGVGHFPAGLFDNAVSLGSGESLLDLRKLFLGDAVLIILSEHQAGLIGVLLQRPSDFSRRMRMSSSSWESHSPVCSVVFQRVSRFWSMNSLVSVLAKAAAVCGSGESTVSSMMRV